VVARPAVSFPFRNVESLDTRSCKSPPARIRHRYCDRNRCKNQVQRSPIQATGQISRQKLRLRIHAFVSTPRTTFSRLTSLLFSPTTIAPLWFLPMIPRLRRGLSSITLETVVQPTRVFQHTSILIVNPPLHFTPRFESEFTAHQLARKPSLSACSYPSYFFMVSCACKAGESGCPGSAMLA
jgi:hypothetical protein